MGGNAGEQNPMSEKHTRRRLEITWTDKDKALVIIQLLSTQNGSYGCYPYGIHGSAAHMSI